MPALAEALDHPLEPRLREAGRGPVALTAVPGGELGECTCPHDCARDHENE